LGSLFISDYHTKKGNRFDIVSPNKGAHFHNHATGSVSVRGENEKLARIAVDINPPDEVTPVNVRVEYKSGPLFITFSRALIDRIVNFFDTGAPASQNLVQLAQAANNQLGEMTKAQLRYALVHRKTLKLNIDLDAPMIIIPQDIHDPTSPSLLIDLGHLRMTARPPPPQKYALATSLVVISY
jgi:vacuolar protein sorting-associated protein 13A/C